MTHRIDVTGFWCQWNGQQLNELCSWFVFRFFLPANQLIMCVCVWNIKFQRTLDLHNLNSQSAERPHQPQIQLIHSFVWCAANWFPWIKYSNLDNERDSFIQDKYDMQCTHATEGRLKHLEKDVWKYEFPRRKKRNRLHDLLLIILNSEGWFCIFMQLNLSNWSDLKIIRIKMIQSTWLLFNMHLSVRNSFQFYPYLTVKRYFVSSFNI